MTNSAPDIVSISKPALLLDVGRWAPVCVVLFVAFWPLPGLAATVLTLSALLASYYLIRYRFRGGTQLLDSPAWALTSVLFMAYWLPQVVSLFGALELSESLLKVATDLRYLPFMWLCAIAVGGPERRAHLQRVGRHWVDLDLGCLGSGSVAHQSVVLVVESTQTGDQWLWIL